VIRPHAYSIWAAVSSSANSSIAMKTVSSRTNARAKENAAFNSFSFVRSSGDVCTPRRIGEATRRTG